MLCALTPAVSALADSLIIGYEPYLPITGVAGEKHEGYAIEVVKKIYSSHTMVFELIPYIRSLKMLEKGEIDMLLGTAKIDFTDETKIVFPQETLAISSTVFFVRHDSNWQFKDLNSLKRIKLGLVKGYKYNEFEKISDKSRFFYISGIETTARSLKMLISGHISVFYEDRNVVQSVAMKLGMSTKIKEAGFINGPLPLYNAISNKNPNAKKLADEFDTKLRQLRKSKQLDQILKKYNLKDWK